MQQESHSPVAPTQPQVQGHCDPRFASVAKLMQHFVATDAELGASLAVIVDDVPVIDIWAGHADVERTKPWTRDTIACIFSSSKPITALAALILIDRGSIGLNDPVSKHWPEFAANGKENVLISHLLCHASGLPGWDEPVTFEDLQDTASCTRKLAGQQPWWKPGESSGYHGLTYGFLLGEVVRRVSGRSLTHFIQDELASPLQADFQLGAREEDWSRIAPIEISRTEAAPAQAPPTPGSVAARTLVNPPVASLDANSSTWRHAEVGAGNGHSNASALAKILTVLANGGSVDGKQILRLETAEMIF